MVGCDHRGPARLPARQADPGSAGAFAAGCREEISCPGVAVPEWLRRRSQQLGGFEPGHFLFPATKPDHAAKQEGTSAKDKIDPMRPLKSWRTAWRRLTRAIQCPQCGLLQDAGDRCSACEADTKGLKSPFHGFRFHDTRHQAITELAESTASDQTIMGIAGHVSREMLQHYSHVRMEAKRSATHWTRSL